MNYAKFNYPSKSSNDDITIRPNGTLKLDYKSLLNSKNTNIGRSPNINVQNNYVNLNCKNNGNDFKYYDNFSSSLKDQILSPGDDDISPNFSKNQIVSPTPCLDDDIVFNRLNINFFTKNNQQVIKANEQGNINFNVNKTTKNNKKTLILDLDETLVHSSFKPINYNNILYNPDIFLKIKFRGNNHNVHVLKRPYVFEFLKEMNKIYNIIIFTASVKEYANPLLDTLDSEKVIKQRLFREDCCVGPNGKFVKDLNILNMNLKDLILVDNNPISYSFNKSNGIPIKTWHFDKTDQELIRLIPVLQFLASVNDVRDYIPKLVENDEIDYCKINVIIKELNNENEQDKFLKPRAKSQKKIFARNKGKNNSYVYSYKNICNIDNNNKDEDSIINIEQINKNKYINYYLTDKTNNIYTNVKNHNNYNLKNENKNNNSARNILEHNINNNKNYLNISSYGNNNYIQRKNNNNNYNNREEQKNNNIYNNMNLKEQKNALLKMDNDNNGDNNDKLFLSKNKFQSIQNYNKKSNNSKNSFLNNLPTSFNNNYLINEYKIQNQNNRNTTKDISNIIKDKINDNNNSNDININHYNDNINKKGEINNTNNNNYLKEKSLNNTGNTNYLNNIDNESIKKSNYIFNYESKSHYGFITPKINKTKYISDYSMNNYSTKNNNNYNITSNLNINNNKNDKNINYNIENKNINIINKKADNSDINKYSKDLKKENFYKDYKYNYLNNNKENENGNANLLKNDESDKHSNTATNFYPSKNNNNIYRNHYIIYNYNNLNLNSNLNTNLYKNLEYNTEIKNNPIPNGQEDNILKIDNNLKKCNSPYYISKETNYYIKRRMKLNKEKLIQRKNKKENKNDGYDCNGNQKKWNKNNVEISDNNYYYNPGKYYKNNIFFMENKNINYI